MNSTLKPHLLIEVIGFNRQRLWSSKLCMLFLSYRDFPEAFALAFRYRCYVATPYFESHFFKSSETYKIVVTTMGNLTFVFGEKLHIPILLRIAGRLAHRIHELPSKGSWMEPFLEGVDKNQNLEYIGRKVSRSFLKRYLQHHDSLPTVQFGSPHIDFAVLDDLDEPKIDTVVYSYPCAKFNTKPCRVTNIVVGQHISIRSNPLIRKGRTLVLDLDCLKSLEFNGKMPYTVVLRMIKNTYSTVEKLSFDHVKLTVPSKSVALEKAVKHINAIITLLWKHMLKHPSAVTVSAFYERFFFDPDLLFSQKGFPDWTITRSGFRVQCRLQRVAGNKSLNVLIETH